MLFSEKVSVMKLTNGKKTMLDDLQEGIKRAYPMLKHVAGTRGFINRNFKDEIVPLISGGGSGHDPAHWGFVGDGMLAGAISGELFVPPTAKEIVEVTQKLTSKKRVFYIVKNFERDVDEFCKARLFLENAGWKVGMAIVKDDISVDAASFEKRRRGVAGTVFFHKILGDYARKGASVEELQKVADELLENVKTIGVAFSGDNFLLKKNEIYYGIGIHGEEGYRKEPFESSEMLARELISKLKLSFGFKSQDTYAVLVNSLGEVTKMEQLIFNNDVCELLEAEEISIGFDKAGTFLTSFGIKGISLTLLKIEDENWLKALKTKVDALEW